MKVKVKLVAVQEYMTHRNPEDGSEWTTLNGCSVLAVTNNGRRWIHAHRFETYANALAFILLVCRSGNEINTDRYCWGETDPVYGSAEYDRSGMEQQWAQREREDAVWE